jgi:hypothetical protein
VPSWRLPDGSSARSAHSRKGGADVTWFEPVLDDAGSGQRAARYVYCPSAAQHPVTCANMFLLRSGYQYGLTA